MTTAPDTFPPSGRGENSRPAIPCPPATRFQGSKLKLLDWLWENMRPLPFQTVLDAFGGSASVSHFLKGKGKSVTFNDALTSSYLSGVALVENNHEQLSDAHIHSITDRAPGIHYDDLISRTFGDIYFTDAENNWLDVAAQNIPRLPSRYTRALAYHALFQSALAKRPYNLFHRRNLYMRLADVKRTFGNKASWDKPFDAHFTHFARLTNQAVFRWQQCFAMNQDVSRVTGRFDLVYLDPPYLNGRGVGVDYGAFYHFLEGLADYGGWESRIDFSSRHRRMKRRHSPWTSRTTIVDAFRSLFHRFRGSMLAVSYRSDGIPSVPELADLLREVKRDVKVCRTDGAYTYALSTNTRSSEVLLIGTD